FSKSVMLWNPPPASLRFQIVCGMAASPWPDPGSLPSDGSESSVSWCQPTSVSTRKRLLLNSVVHLSRASYALLERLCATDSYVPTGYVTSGLPVRGSMENLLSPPDDAGAAMRDRENLLLALSAYVSLPIAWIAWDSAVYFVSVPGMISVPVGSVR